MIKFLSSPNNTHGAHSIRCKFTYSIYRFPLQSQSDLDFEFILSFSFHTQQIEYKRDPFMQEFHKLLKNFVLVNFSKSSLASNLHLRSAFYDYIEMSLINEFCINFQINWIFWIFRRIPSAGKYTKKRRNPFCLIWFRIPTEPNEACKRNWKLQNRIVLFPVCLEI